MSSGHQRIKWRRNIAENFNRLSRVHERYRQTTDGRTTTYSEHEHEFTFAKKQKKKQRASVGYMPLLLHAIIQYYTHHYCTNINLERI